MWPWDLLQSADSMTRQPSCAKSTLWIAAALPFALRFVQEIKGQIRLGRVIELRVPCDTAFEGDGRTSALAVLHEVHRSSQRVYFAHSRHGARIDGDAKFRALLRASTPVGQRSAEV